MKAALIAATMTLQHTLFAIAMVAAVTVATLPEAEAQRRCPDRTSVGAHQPCRPQTATAKKEGKTTSSVGGLKAKTGGNAAKDKRLDVESWSWGGSK